MKDYALLDGQWAMFCEAWPLQPMPDQREAQRAFYKLEPGRALFGQMLAALEIHAASERWQSALREDKPQMIPMAKTWIARRKWGDDPATYPPANGGGGGRNERCPECGNAWRVHKQFPNPETGRTCP